MPRQGLHAHRTSQGAGRHVHYFHCVVLLIVVSGENTHFDGRFVPAMLDKVTASSLHLSPFMRSRKVLTADNLGDAVRGCDTFVTGKVVRGTMSLG